MYEYKEILDQETKKFIGIAEEILNLESNFRTYIFERELSEESFRIASREYNERIIFLKEQIVNTEEKISQITEKTEFVTENSIQELNILVGRICRMMVSNKTFTENYGGVKLVDDNEPNLYKEIYDKHIEDAKEFLYYFLKVANRLFNK